MNANPEHRDRAEIEVTPEMIDEGCSILWSWDQEREQASEILIKLWQVRFGSGCRTQEP